MNDSVAVIPQERWSEALELLVSPLPDDMQQAQKAMVLSALNSDPAQAAGLLGHFHGDELKAVCWLQQQPGRTANLWPPVHAKRDDPAIAAALVAKALDVARSRGVVLVQSLLVTDAGPDAETLRRAGFSHVADLLYLVSMADDFPRSLPASELTFVSLSSAETGRLVRIIERSYRGTLDCPALEGVRAIDDVLAGYRAVGRYRPDLWLIAQWRGEDVGCVLLADHAAERVWELVYMGVVPAARGKGLGLEITRYAQWLAAREHVQRLVLAVDAANEPALAMYAAAGFVSWDRRCVFVYAH